jgi:hypothetical protein
MARLTGAAFLSKWAVIFGKLGSGNELALLAPKTQELALFMQQLALA